MSTADLTPAVAVASAAPVKAKRAPRVAGAAQKSIVRALKGSGKDTFSVIASQKKDGKWGVYTSVNYFKADGSKEKHERGASVSVDTLEAAKAAVEERVQKAAADGWKLPSPTPIGKFNAKPDAYGLDSLPKPR